MTRELTVAHIRDPEDADSVEVLFLESARVYELRRSNPSFDTLLQRLRAANAERRAVTVRLSSPDGEVIEDVEVS